MNLRMGQDKKLVVIWGAVKNSLWKLKQLLTPPESMPAVGKSLTLSAGGPARRTIWLFPNCCLNRRGAWSTTLHKHWNNLPLLRRVCLPTCHWILECILAGRGWGVGRILITKIETHFPFLEGAAGRVELCLHHQQKKTASSAVFCFVYICGIDETSRVLGTTSWVTVNSETCYPAKSRCFRTF